MVKAKVVSIGKSKKKGSKVMIKTKSWYYSKKNSHGFVETGICGFSKDMTDWCGKEMTISKVIRDDDGVYYKMMEDDGKYSWDDNMFQ